MLDVLLISFLSKIFSALVGFLLIWLLLRLLDKISGVDFNKRVQELNNMEFSVYAGARLLAVCIFVAETMS